MRPNPYVILVVLLLWLATLVYSWDLGKGYAEGKQAKTELLVQRVAGQAQLAAAAAIAQIKPVNQYTKQVLDREVRIVPDYSRCVHSPDGLRTINAALENRPGATGDSVVPGTDTPN